MDCKNVKTLSLQGTKQSPIPCNKIIFQFFLVLFIGTAFNTIAQRQLIVLKNEEVLARYQVGDVLHFAREKDKEILIQRILDLNDTLIMMNFDSVTYYRIARLDISARKPNTFVQKLGRYMILAGVLLPAIELLNTGVFQDEDQQATVSSGVLITSGVLIGTGAAMVFIKKPYFKPGRKHRLIIVSKGSPFYKEKPLAEGYLSPYLPK